MPWPWKASSAFAGALLLLSGLPARADCEAGFKAFDSADYERSLYHLLPCARAGNAVAQFEVGVWYEFGRGVPQGDVEAVRWYRLAADQGIPEAQFNLGVKYAKGEGVLQDYAKVVHWYRLAAEQGDAGAQYNLAVRYSYGEGTLQDDMLAYVWSTPRQHRHRIRRQPRRPYPHEPPCCGRLRRSARQATSQGSCRGRHRRSRSEQ